MRPLRLLVLTAACCAVVSAGSAQKEMRLWSPWAPPSRVGENGTLHEDWGAFALHLVQPEGVSVSEQTYEESPFPSATTVKTAGTVVLTETAYRAPVWPAGVDVIETVLSNTSAGTVEAKLEISLPENVNLGKRLGTVGGRAVLSLPEGMAIHGTEREWGCAAGGFPMRGWAKPGIECDPAFRNIRAGMGGLTVEYRFAVQPGSGKTVVLGFCESFHGISGYRPVVINVEGTEETECDPIGSWGQHAPGCLEFDAEDVDGDGRIQVSVEPHPKAGDKNPILNAIWVFPPETELNLNDVLAGRESSEAEIYVDVGGEKDQSLYEGGSLTYAAELGPKSEEKLLFLLGCPGGGSVPNPEKSSWTSSSLRKAATDVWADAKNSTP